MGEQDGSLHRVLGGSRRIVEEALAGAKAPPPSRPKVRGPLRDNPDWPPPPLLLPTEPRAETWRILATEYFAERGISLTPSGNRADDDLWIEEVRIVDPVAARHVEDMRSLFMLGEEPEKRAEPRGAVDVMRDLNREANEVDPGARVVAGDFRLVDAAEGYSSLSARLIRGEEDIVVGPHYAYTTLVFALRERLKKRDASHSG